MKFSHLLTRNLLPVALVGMTVLAGCQKVEPGSTPSASSKPTAGETTASLGSVNYSGSLSDAEKNQVVATVDGQTITMADLYSGAAGSNLFKLRTDMANKEYQIKKRGLDDLIETRLLEKEAKEKGVSTEQLLKTEVDAKVKPPSDEDVQNFWNQNSRRLPPGATLDEHKQEIVDLLKSRDSERVKDEYVKSLKDKAKVEISLPFPELPVAQVSMDDDPVRGNKDAPVKIIEWSDYQCPYCKRNVDVLKQVEEKYGDKVAVVFRDFPLPFHDKAEKAAEAAGCAGEQGKYWEFHDKLFADQSQLDVDGLKKTAGELGMDTAKFNSCLDSSKFKTEIQKDIEDGKLAGVTGTPASFINGKMVNGAAAFETYQAIIDSELAKAGVKASTGG